MRQVGFFAAAGLYALDHHLERLHEDHDNCRAIAERLAQCRYARVDLDRVMTNILIFDIAEEGPEAPVVVERARKAGVLVFAFGPRTVRAVTHLNVTRAQCERAAEILATAIDEP